MVKSFRNTRLRPKKSALVAGRSRVLQAMREGLPLDRIYLQRNIQGAELDDIRRLAREAGVPVNLVPVEKLNSFHVEGHEGCVALKSRVHYQDLQQVISFVVEQGRSPLFLMLDGITDIRNIGAMARSAFCFGVDALILPEKGVGALNEDAILTSAGALEQLSVCRTRNLAEAVQVLHLNGIRVLAGDMKAQAPLSSLDLTIPCALVMGGEEQGIHPSLLSQCDEIFRIPMPGDFESLNVSVAAGVSLYEASRQRLSGPAGR